MAISKRVSRQSEWMARDMRNDTRSMYTGNTLENIAALKHVYGTL